MSNIKKLRSGHTVEEVSAELLERMAPDFPIYDGSIRLNPGNWFMSKHAPDFLDKIYDFKFRPTDTVVSSYPKSGTTWMLEIVWTLQHNPDLNNPKADMDTDLRAPHLEMDLVMMPPKIPRIETVEVFMNAFKEVAPDCMDSKLKGVTYLEHLEDPRVIKSHLPLELLNPSVYETSKVIYIARDVRDIIISKAHFWKLIAVHSYKGDFDRFVDYFINEEQYSHPYWSHIKCAYDLRNHPNVLFLYFEHLKENPLREIKRVSDFLGLKRTPQQIQNVAEYTNFKNMKKRTQEGKQNEPMSGGGVFFNKSEESDGQQFFRKGEVGSWKQRFSDTQERNIKKWIAENMSRFDDEFLYKSEFI